VRDRRRTDETAVNADPEFDIPVQLYPYSVSVDSRKH
jgi:hypothetical protein